MINGGSPRLPSSGGLCGVPLCSWMIMLPVMLASARRARVSCLIGVPAYTRIRARTLRGSSGSSHSASTSPTLMPLYSTELPLDSPLTARLKLIS